MTPRTQGEDELIAIATVGKPHGLKGFCYLTAYGRSLDSLDFPCDVLVGANEEKAVRLRIADLRDGSGRPVCRFEGCENRESVEPLRNQTVFSRRSALPDPPKGDFFHFELMGATVKSDCDETIFGRVVDIHNFPTIDALEVEKEDHSTFFLPMTAELVVNVDTKAGTITVRADSIGDL